MLDWGVQITQRVLLSVGSGVFQILRGSVCGNRGSAFELGGGICSACIAILLWIAWFGLLFLPLWFVPLFSSVCMAGETQCPSSAHRYGYVDTPP